MEIIADLHIHSRFSRGCSKSLTLNALEKWARVKGVGLLGTGDFTHPQWLGELRAGLIEDGTGILRSKTGFPFVLQSEISLIYSAGGKGRKVHLVLLAPDFDTVERLNKALLRIGRIDYDGRPIFGISCPELVGLLNEINPRIEVIPAHVWTPWFGLFGSKSGFDSVEECFGEQARHIHALETGMSSDPPMNWRLSSLSRYSLVSFSDSHSFWPWRLAREATIFELESLDYDSLITAISTGKGLKATIEVDPNYGKYHYDGHRGCGVRFSPAESRELKGICPVCRQPLTIGVLSRVEGLADRPEGFTPDGAPGFFRLLPLSEVISSVQGVGLSSKQMWESYNPLVHAFGNEFEVLLRVPKAELTKVVGEELAAAILLNREGAISVEPGYDGVYGVPRLGAVEQPKEMPAQQKSQQKSQLGLSQFFS